MGTVFALALLVPALVQLDHRVGSVESIVAELARKSGQNLKIRREMADEVLYVSLKPHEPNELMALIAKAASAEWSEDHGFYLGRSPSLKLKLAEAERSKVGADLAASLKPLIGEGEAPWLGGNAAKVREIVHSLPTSYSAESMRTHAARISGFTPVGRLMFRALRAMSIEQLAGLPIGVPVRYALHPNTRQRPLPAEADLRQYVEERQEFAAEAQNLSPEERRASPDSFGSYESKTTILNPIPILIAYRGAHLLRLMLYVFDPSGRVVDHSMITISADPSDQVRTLPGYPLWKALPLKVHGDAALFSQAVMGESLDPGLATKLRDPVSNEPLGLLLQDPLDTLASKMGAGEAIVALPDETGEDAGLQFGYGTDLGNFARGLTSDVDSEVHNGLWLGRAWMPILSSEMKASRSTLRSFLRPLAETLPNLDAISRYALAQNPAVAFTGLEHVLMYAGTGILDSGFVLTLLDRVSGGRELLRFYASLTLAQKASLAAGASIEFGDFSSVAKAELEAAIFLCPSSINDSRRGFQNPADITLLTDRIPWNAPIRLALRAPESVVAYPWKGFKKTLEISYLGTIMASQERTNEFSEDRGYPPVAQARFIPGVRRGFDFALPITSFTTYNGSLIDYRFSPEARALPLGELPPEHLKALRLAHDKFRRQNPH